MVVAPSIQSGISMIATSYPATLSAQVLCYQSYSPLSALDSHMSQLQPSQSFSFRISFYPERQYRRVDLPDFTEPKITMAVLIVFARSMDRYIVQSSLRVGSEHYLVYLIWHIWSLREFIVMIVLFSQLLKNEPVNLSSLRVIVSLYFEYVKMLYPYYSFLLTSIQQSSIEYALDSCLASSPILHSINRGLAQRASKSIVARGEVPINRCNNQIHQIILGPGLQKMKFIFIKDRTELSQRNQILLIPFPLIVAVHLQLCIESSCPSNRTIFVEFEYFNALILSPILRLIDFTYSNGVLLQNNREISNFDIAAIPPLLDEADLRGDLEEEQTEDSVSGGRILPFQYCYFAIAYQ